MNYARAQEILESHGVVEVLYQGQPIWIEKVINDHKALVSEIGSENQQEVLLKELSEGAKN